MFFVDLRFCLICITQRDKTGKPSMSKFFSLKFRGCLLLPGDNYMKNDIHSLTFMLQKQNLTVL